LNRSFALRIVAAAVAAAGWCSPVVAQDTPTSPSAGLVAVLDVAKVFEKNTRFQSRLEEIKNEAAQITAKLETDQESLRQQAKLLPETFKPGSDEFRQKEAELEQQLVALRSEGRQANTDLLNREAKIYYDTYVEMHQVVTSLSAKWGISLVIRFDSSAVDATNRTDVVKAVNRAVVFQKDLDLTDYVVDAMNNAAPGGPTSTTTPPGN
jgi:Skp family chaperone for outer membrane proteins